MYEGLKVYNVEGQTIHGIVSDLLTGIWMVRWVLWVMLLLGRYMQVIT